MFQLMNDPQLPAPKKRADVDSFLNSFADACGASALPALTAASCGDGIEGDMLCRMCYEKEAEDESENE